MEKQVPKTTALDELSVEPQKDVKKKSPVILNRAERRKKYGVVKVRRIRTTSCKVVKKDDQTTNGLH